MIMFLIAATTCIAVVGSVYLAVLNILDRQHRLCSEKILPRAAAGSGVEHWIQGQTVKVPFVCPQAMCSVTHRCSPCQAGALTVVHDHINAVKHRDVFVDATCSEPTKTL